jgi:hypothetical protein
MATIALIQRYLVTLSETGIDQSEHCIIIKWSTYTLQVALKEQNYLGYALADSLPQAWVEDKKGTWKAVGAYISKASMRLYST